MKFCVAVHHANSPASQDKFPEITPMYHMNALHAARYGSVHLITDDEETVVLDGPVFDGHAITASAAQAAINGAHLKLIQTNSFNTPPDELDDAAGIFVALLPDASNGSLLIKLDPLGQYPLLVAKQNGLTFFANDCLLLEDIMKAYGIEVTRNLRSFASETLFFLGVGNATALDQAHLSPFGHDVAINLQTGSISYKPKTLFAKGTCNREIALENAAQSLIRNMNLIRDAFGEKAISTDLTGGVDGRLNLAAVLASGFERPLVWFRDQDDPNHPDTTIPSLMCTDLGLVRAVVPDNRGTEASDPVSLSRRAGARHGGTSSIHNHYLGRLPLRGVAKIRGGVGIINKEYYSHSGFFQASLRWTFQKRKRGHLLYRLGRILGSSTSLLTALEHEGFIVRNLRSKATRAAIFSPQLIRDVHDGAMTELEAFASLQVTMENRFGLFFLANRSRRHFGGTSLQLNRVVASFEPLANHTLWALSRFYTVQERKDRKIQRDLFEKLAPRLLDYPFEKAYRELDLGQDTSRLGKAPPPPIKHLLDFPETPLGNSIPLSADFKNLVGKLTPALAKHNLLNLAELKKRVNRPDFDTLYREDQQLYGRLHRGLIWILGEEDGAPIKNSVTDPD